MTPSLIGGQVNCLDSLVVKNKAASVPGQDLHAISALGAEDVKSAVERLCCVQHNRSYVSDEIMWRRRSNASPGRPL
ncbi:hypothetical protein, partial [Bradyrhizobium sp. USDA 3458]|uniref:hypothetical protein n=1 Tax=Bradyrhizobium sp. USDA 3458 TaxID=2591461 RepID=UPI001FED507C